MAAAQAYILAGFNKFDVHVFVERNNKGIRLEDLVPDQILKSERIFYHLDKLECFLPEGLPESQKWPSIVYLRLFVPDLLKNYSRLVYLDADIAIADDPTVLFDIDIPTTIAAVHDYGILGETIVPFPGVEYTTDEWLGGIGLEGCRYFNSGVLLINTERWSQLEIQRLLSKYFDQFGHRVTMFDQDFLNYTFKNDWTELSPRWNFQTSLFDYGFEHEFKPVVVHFTAPLKPWNGDFYSYQQVYLSYFALLFKQLQITLPKPATRPRQRYIKRMKTAVRRLLLRLGIQFRRERVQRRIWGRYHGLAHDFLGDALEKGLFADFSEAPILGEPKVFFDGHVVRTANLEDTLALLGPELVLPRHSHSKESRPFDKLAAAQSFREEEDHCEA
nr:glycosyltransferase family 8 protein [Pseudovibrio japonicus]